MDFGEVSCNVHLECGVGVHHDYVIVPESCKGYFVSVRELYVVLSETTHRIVHLVLYSSALSVK